MDDHRRTLAWLDGSLEWTRTRSQTSLMELPNLVRTGVLYDMDLSGSPPSTRDRASVDGPAFGANRGA
jgi:hypothetical protein